MDHRLVDAIHDKRLIEFAYKTPGSRVAEPHDYGVQNAAERLLVYQLTGASASGAPHGWKWIDVAHVRSLRALDDLFPGTGADAAQHHRTWDVLFARVE